MTATFVTLSGKATANASSVLVAQQIFSIACAPHGNKIFRTPQTKLIARPPDSRPLLQAGKRKFLVTFPKQMLFA
jgi:hypothetical protein